MYRGGGMTPEQIKDYADNVNGDLIRLFGYTSCSLAKDAAMSFMWGNEDTGHLKVLFHIRWKYKYNLYFLNAGAYDHELEVLLLDGVDLQVKSVENMKGPDNKLLYVLISLEYID